MESNNKDFVEKINKELTEIAGDEKIHTSRMVFREKLPRMRNLVNTAIKMNSIEGIDGREGIFSRGMKRIRLETGCFFYEDGKCRDENGFELVGIACIWGGTKIYITPGVDGNTDAIVRVKRRDVRAKYYLYKDHNTGYTMRVKGKYDGITLNFWREQYLEEALHEFLQQYDEFERMLYEMIFERRGLSVEG